MVPLPLSALPSAQHVRRLLIDADWLCLVRLHRAEHWIKAKSPLRCVLYYKGDSPEKVPAEGLRFVELVWDGVSLLTASVRETTSDEVILRG